MFIHVQAHPRTGPFKNKPTFSLMLILLWV